LAPDGSTDEHRTVASHGNAAMAVAISAAGDLVATGDQDGTVRVGRSDGSEPHLLIGGGGLVYDLAFSPDARWLAATSADEVRLWPVPDVSRPPLYTLPREQLLGKLAALTNVRVVEDAASSTGYRVDLAPFPDWRDVPTW